MCMEHTNLMGLMLYWCPINITNTKAQVSSVVGASIWDRLSLLEYFYLNLNLENSFWENWQGKFRLD